MPLGINKLTLCLCIIVATILPIRRVRCSEDDVEDIADSETTTDDFDSSNSDSDAVDDMSTTEVSTTTTAPMTETTLPVPTSPTTKGCAQRELVECLIKVMDDWARNLWSFKENVAAVNESVCEHHTEMTKCVEFPHCTRRQVLAASQEVSDLVLHRQKSGTFLKSYFLTTFPCSAEGVDILDRQRDCLLKNHVSQMIFSLSTTVENEIRRKLEIQHNPSSLADMAEKEEVDLGLWYCKYLNERLNSFYVIAISECDVEAGYLMCKSVTDAFLNIFPENLGNCQVLCSVKPTPTTVAYSTTVVVDDHDSVSSTVSDDSESTDDAVEGDGSEQGASSNAGHEGGEKDPTSSACQMFSVLCAGFFAAFALLTRFSLSSY